MRSRQGQVSETKMWFGLVFGLTLFYFRYGFTHLSMGDLLREEVASGSEKGKALNDVMKSGRLVSNDLVLGLLSSAIEKRQSTSTGFLIDGYPRKVGNWHVSFISMI